MPNPDLEIEILGNETAEATLVVSSTLELEVNVQAVALTGTVPGEPELVEITLPGPLMVHDGQAVQNEHNAPGLAVLEAADDPALLGIPAGTVILRKP